LQFIDALDDWQRKVEITPLCIDAEKLPHLSKYRKPVCSLEDKGWQRPYQH